MNNYTGKYDLLFRKGICVQEKRGGTEERPRLWKLEFKLDSYNTQP